ncbi:MAG: hypothetical protein JWP29_4576, partial [Rhodoferax sp.]|nr:hypothetical protein [Rhodoferax sp.]
MQTKKFMPLGLVLAALLAVAN